MCKSMPYFLKTLLEGFGVNFDYLFVCPNSANISGFLTAKERPSINAELSADGLQIIVLLLLFATSAVFCLQANISFAILNFTSSIYSEIRK